MGEYPIQTQETPCHTLTTMLVLLRNHNTGLYYSGKDRWTADPFAACHFRFIDLATTFAVDQKLDAADVILDYQAPQCQLSVPVRASCAD